MTPAAYSVLMALTALIDHALREPWPPALAWGVGAFCLMVPPSRAQWAQRLGVAALTGVGVGFVVMVIGGIG